jgi:hypothetical protein
METSEILPLYYTRQQIEQIFDIGKNYADLLPLRVQSEDTFGESKGLEYEHVFIYPTEKFLEWLLTGKEKLQGETRAKLYVALTRAIFSVAIIVEDNYAAKCEDITLWTAN